MMYVLLYALCRGRGLYDVTVGVLVTATCRTGIMIMMMLVVYCLFVCAICLYFRLWVYNTVIARWWVGTASRGLVKVLSCDSEELRNSKLCETQWQTMGKYLEKVDDMWQITTRRHNYVWDKYSVLRFRLRTINHRKNHDISTSFGRLCTICTEVVW